MQWRGVTQRAALTVCADAGRTDQLHAAGVASMSPYYEAALPSANSVASIIPALTAYATAAMPHLGSLSLPLNLPPASLAQATRQVSYPCPVEKSPCWLRSKPIAGSFIPHR